MRTGSSVSMDVNPGRSQVSPKTSAANPTRMRGNPRIARKPKRRSRLSSRLIASATLEKHGGYSTPVAFLYVHLIGVYALSVNEPAQKKTALYDEHVKRGAKMVPFAGWLMPVQYTSIVEEHQAVRNNIGMFDISHMGQLIVDGGGARSWLNTMLTNNIDKLEVGQGQYTFLLNERGGIIDDLIAYRIEKEKFLLVVNASCTDQDFAWLDQHRPNN